MKTEEQNLNTAKPTSLELENQTVKKTKRPFYKQPCLLITIAILLLVLLVIIILIFTVFKAKQPTTKLVSAKFSGVAPRVSFPAIKIELNISLDLVLNVYNPNHVSFKHGRGSSQVFYLADQVGEVDVAPGNIGAKGSEDIPVRLTLEADKFDMTSLARDVLGGMMSFEIRTRVPGRATILGFIKKHVISVSTCHLDVQVPSFDVSKQDCKSKAKL